MKSSWNSLLSLGAACVVVAGMTACESQEAPAENTALAAPIVDAPDPNEREAPWSDVVMTHVRSGDALQPQGSPLQFQASRPDLTTVLEQYSVYVNGALLENSTLDVAADRLIFRAPLKEGRNAIQIYAVDRADSPLVVRTEVWAGTSTVQGRVLDETGNPVAGATVVAALGDDSTVTAQTTTDSAGQYVLRNFPARTVLVKVDGPTGIPGSTTSVAGSAFPDVVLYRFGVPVSSANHAFLAGMLGWINRNGASLSLVDHVLHPGPAPAVAQPETAPAGEAIEGVRQNLRVGTSGVGTRTVTYTFLPPPGSRTAQVRYRFQTMEFPTYFGSRYNDSFNVALRSQSGQSVASSDTMNGLGRDAFDAGGSTAWKDLSLELASEGEPVQLDVTVANVDDNRMDSAAIVDLVSASPLSIAQASLLDIDNSRLGYLSAAPHPYFNGATRVHATFKVAGPAATRLTSLELQVRQAGVVKARAPLITSLSPSVYKAFETSGIALSRAQLAFELPAKELAAISTATDGTLDLKLVAVANDGSRVEKAMGTVQLLDRWAGPHRYGGRDESRGGDDWLTASAREICNAVNVSWGDFSNMNAGSFAPDHSSHTSGKDADGWYAGYSARDAAAAEKMLALLNTPGVGAKVGRVYVTHTQSPGNAFYDAYRNVTLADGRKASSVIHNAVGHTTHFHWNMG